ncbi:hypothetical protein [Streptomyces sp. NPDC056723]|uniref:hypothetical protein n=1 Tax=Streptomyces sp. NPDC056723 TaxID=3345925 RepID=UPI003683B32D
MNPNWAIALVLIGISGAIFCALQVRRSLREPLERDQILAAAPFHTDPPRIETEPGTDTDLLLEAHFIYHGPAGLQRLRDAINEAREETL